MALLKCSAWQRWKEGWLFGIANGSTYMVSARWSQGIQTSYLEAWGSKGQCASTSGNTFVAFYGPAPDATQYPPLLCSVGQSGHKASQIQWGEYRGGSKNLWACFKTSIGYIFFKRIKQTLLHLLTLFIIFYLQLALNYLYK